MRLTLSWNFNADDKWFHDFFLFGLFDWVASVEGFPMYEFCITSLNTLILEMHSISKSVCHSDLM